MNKEIIAHTCIWHLLEETHLQRVDNVSCVINHTISWPDLK